MSKIKSKLTKGLSVALSALIFSLTIPSGFKASADSYVDLGTNNVWCQPLTIGTGDIGQTTTISGISAYGISITDPGHYNIVLDNVQITDVGFSMVTGANVNLTLKGDNIITGGTGRAGIEVPAGAALTISKGSGDADNADILTVTGGDGLMIGAGAGIGGAGGVGTMPGESSGTLTINGGTVLAYGGSSKGDQPNGAGAGIGGGGGAGIGTGDGTGGSSDSVTITGGSVTAQGGNGSAYGGSGAGIGGGAGAALQSSNRCNGGNCGSSADPTAGVTVSGGTVSATGGEVNQTGNTSNTTTGAGIGGGGSINGSGGSLCCDVTLKGGFVTATGGAVIEDMVQSSNNAYCATGAGIGGGGSFCINNTGGGNVGGTAAVHILVNGSNVTATGGAISFTNGNNYAGSGAGIGGGGDGGNGGNDLSVGGGGTFLQGSDYVQISGTVNAVGGAISVSSATGSANKAGSGAGIGGGGGGNSCQTGSIGGNGGPVSVSGGILKATGGSIDTQHDTNNGNSGAGIGGGGNEEAAGTQSGKGGDVTLMGGFIQAYGGRITAGNNISTGDGIGDGGGIFNGNHSGTVVITNASVNASIFTPITNGTQTLYAVNVENLPPNHNVSIKVGGGSATSSTTDVMGYLYLWLPVTPSGSLATISITDTGTGLSYTGSAVIAAGSSSAIAVKSADATLKGLALSSGSLNGNFSSATLTYTANVPNSVSSVTVTPALNDGNARVKIFSDGTEYRAGTGNIPLVVGDNVIHVTVTAQDCITVKDYQITVTRPSAILGVTVTPAIATVIQGAAQQFAATVNLSGNLSNTVHWTVTGNKSSSTTIDNTGKLTVATDESALKLTVEATSTADSTQHSTAAVSVVPAMISNNKGITFDLTGATLPAGVTSVSLGSTAQGNDSSTYSMVTKLIGQNQTLGNLSGLMIYDLKLLDQNGNPITNFAGKIKVKIPIPAGMSGNLKVFWYNPANGTVTDMSATPENGYMVFETTHFSYYAIAQLAAPAQPNTTSPTGAQPGTASPISSNKVSGGATPTVTQSNGTTPNASTGDSSVPFLPLALLGASSAAGLVIVRKSARYKLKKNSHRA
ncbi:MAG TPA: cadherin-like beta sandwich domain-containing protein [Oscillospiraceae bacterium]|nr:cadherin-like beta sandwich domain-containing protein [Oscillospiraceae bacterium]